MSLYQVGLANLFYLLTKMSLAYRQSVCTSRLAGPKCDALSTLSGPCRHSCPGLWLLPLLSTHRWFYLRHRTYECGLSHQSILHSFHLAWSKSLSLRRVPDCRKEVLLTHVLSPCLSVLTRWKGTLSGLALPCLGSQPLSQDRLLS